MLLSIIVLAAAMSPLTIDISTRDGHRFALPVADADAVALRVCARHDGDTAKDAICAPVVHGRNGSSVVVDIDDSDDLHWQVMSTSFEARSGASAAMAIGFGVGSVGLAIGAVIATAASMAPDVEADDAATAASSIVVADGRQLAGVAAVVLWAATGIGLVATMLATVVAVGDAAVVHE